MTRRNHKMKRYILLAAISIISFQNGYAVSEQTVQVESNQQMKEAYQQGLKTAEEAKRNQQLWAQGQGDPKMAEAYQQGLQAAKDGVRNQQLWAQGQGDPKMAEAYQQGFKSCRRGK